ncbi:transposase (fragment) [Petrocella atlantisensis]|uniref:Transposase n=1 Tax=Petrocella atlantisensis TaxID=2173034 RepID=A0A3P7PTW3_9FIRM
MQANGGTSERTSKVNQELRKEKKEKEKLQKELDRKEKALAEAAALLVLGKKANAIWGTDNEED